MSNRNAASVVEPHATHTDAMKAGSSKRTNREPFPFGTKVLVKIVPEWRIEATSPADRTYHLDAQPDERLRIFDAACINSPNVDFS